MKIVWSALAAESNQLDKLELGNIDIYRDWGYAPEVVKLIYQLMQHQPGDFNICSGNPTSLRTILEECFNLVGLDYKKYLITNKSLFRPSEIEYVGGSPLRLVKALGHKLEISGCEPSKLILQELKKDKNYGLQL
jgi:GDPmannose 4,6-dehydratase